MNAKPETLDRRHYVNHVLQPVADAILLHLDSSFAEATDQPRQLSLL